MFYYYYNFFFFFSLLFEAITKTHFIAILLATFMEFHKGLSCVDKFLRELIAHNFLFFFFFICFNVPKKIPKASFAFFLCCLNLFDEEEEEKLTEKKVEKR